MSKYFKEHETACKCGCGFNEQNQELYDILDELREHFGAPITLTSGNRCHAHNREEGGVRYSQHVFGRAVDMKVKGISPLEVYAYLDELYPLSKGIGLYHNRVHFDVRKRQARWSH